MAISPEVLNDTLEQLLPDYENMFLVWSPVLNRIVKGKGFKHEQLKGPSLDFRMLYQGPGDVTQVVYGSERLASTRKDMTARASVYTTRLIYGYNVPCKEMAQESGPEGVEHLVEQYPEAALLDFHQRFTQQFLSGNGENMAGLVTLNGGVDYSPEGTPLDGVMEFADPASQGDTVFGVAKQGATGGIPGYYNGYGAISSMQLDGDDILRREYTRASKRGKNMGPVDLLICDETSYNNYIHSQRDRVVITDAVKGESGLEDIEEGIKFLKATMYMEEFLDTTASGLSSLNGVIYGLKTSTWRMITTGKDDKMETKGLFSLRGPQRRPDLDAFQWEYIFHGQLYCKFLPANFVVVGGQIA